MRLIDLINNWVEDKQGRAKLALYDTEEGLIGHFTLFVFKKQLSEPMSQNLTNKEVVEWSVDWRRKTLIVYI